jgi:hypothetical protein
MIWDLITSRGSTEGVRDAAWASDTVPKFTTSVAFRSIAAAVIDGPKFAIPAQEQHSVEIPFRFGSSGPCSLWFYGIIASGMSYVFGWRCNSDMRCTYTLVY